jgi:bacterial/archaeal transporter family protein
MLMPANVLLLLLVPLIFYTLYNFFIKVSSGNIHQVVGAVILQVTAAIFGGLILLYLKLTNKELLITQKGVMFAILAGVAIGAAEITYFLVFSKGVSASVAIPVVWGGVILLGSILGIIFLNESFTMWKAFASVLIIAGISIFFLK